MDVSKFTNKLNKLDGVIQTVEEEVTLTDGVYNGPLAHDNINKKSLNIYTGMTLTGDKITNYFLSTPSETPWKYIIKILAPNINKVYITYETVGDQVEAEDINNLQNVIVDTQNALNGEIDRATKGEKVLTDNLNSEISRAKSAEGTLTTNQANEVTRATNAENTLTTNLNAEVNRAKGAENTLTSTLNTNKPIWDDKYTKNEVDNKINQVVSNMDWKESVATYANIATTYPTPDDGWTVNVKDTDITYRYSGSAWIPISANSIPLATSSVDGKMSKQDKIDHDDMVNKRHTHSNKGILDAITQNLLDVWNATSTNNHTHNNKTILDTITQVLLDSWNSAFTHISDSVKHITSAERTNWNSAYSSNHAHGNKSVIDTITQALINSWNSAYTHISDTIKHITSAERTLWNTVSNKVDKVDGKTLVLGTDWDNVKTEITAAKGTYSSMDERLKSVSANSSNDILYITSNTGNDYSVTIPNLTALTDGYPLTIKFNAASTGAITINPSGLGAKNVVDYFGNVVTNVRKDLIANLRYESTSNSFILLGKGGGGTATSAQIIKDKTATTNDGLVAGTLDLTNLVTGNIKSGVTINGVSGKSSIVDTAGANLASGYMLNGASGYSNGSLLYGNIQNHSGADSPANSINGTGPGRIYVRPQQGYYDGSVASYVDDENFVASNILSGKSIFGLWGNATAASLGGRRYASGTLSVGSYTIAISSLGLSFTPSVISGSITSSYAGTHTFVWARNGFNSYYEYGDGGGYEVILASPTVVSVSVAVTGLVAWNAWE